MSKLDALAARHCCWLKNRESRDSAKELYPSDVLGVYVESMEDVDAEAMEHVPVACPAVVLFFHYTSSPLRIMWKVMYSYVNTTFNS
ncbi:hypothetical protein OUZ56_002863 [Daphnia magna]|uniref:Uncharacterized protein n=1 Tax=Daphnia magna TaxID=35525 RepID=A0ABR0A728_9CRUS|nr:hypothetical protein OUZ56_002863 [Daphnia magna]